MSLETMFFRQDLLIPFHLADPAGIIFFGHVFTLSHQVFEAFILDALQLPWREWFQNPDWIVPIKQADASYSTPLKAGEKSQITLQLAELRTNSFTVQTHFYQSEQLACAVKTIHVFCQRSNHQKQAIPPSIRSQLELYLAHTPSH